MNWRTEYFKPAGRPHPPGKTWPEDVALERITAISLNARTTWFALLGLLTFVMVTLLGVEDIDFFGYGRQTQLPLIGVSVPTEFFFIAAPILTAAVYAYFHFYLMKLWDALGRAPAKVEGDALGDRIHPWLISDAALLLRDVCQGDGAAPMRSLRWVSAFTSVMLTWGFGWVVLGAAWVTSFPAHREWLSLGILACLLFSLWVGLTSAAAVWGRTAKREFERKKRTRASRSLSGIAIFCGCLLVAGFSWVKTEGGLERYLPESTLPAWMITGAFTKDNPFTVPDESLTGILTPADLFEAQLTEKPADWQNYQTAENAARRKWCDQRDLTWALCVKKPDAREIAARERWCKAPVQDSLKRNATECASYFSNAEADFQAAWSARRNDYLSVLKKPNLEGYDLRGANLASAFLPDIDMEGARMEGANLSRAQMEGANLFRAQMEGADLWDAQMEGAIFRDAQMEGAILWGAKMEGADLRGTQMEGADLRGAQMKGADLSRAVLKSVEFYGATIGHSLLPSTDFTDARDMTQSQLEQAVGDAETILPLDV